jgi:hypothetical protein
MGRENTQFPWSFTRALIVASINSLHSTLSSSRWYQRCDGETTAQGDLLSLSYQNTLPRGIWRRRRRTTTTRCGACALPVATSTDVGGEYIITVRHVVSGRNWHSGAPLYGNTRSSCPHVRPLNLCVFDKLWNR